MPIKMTPEIRRKLGAKRALKVSFIRYELGCRGWDQSKIAVELGCTEANISKVMSGQSHSKRVLAKLREIGVPEKYLFDPHTMSISA